MPHFMQLGEVPAKRHTKLKQDTQKSFLGEGMAYEHVVTSMGFDRAYSILYHLRPPTRVKKIESAGCLNLEAEPDLPLRHFHLKSGGMPRAGDPISGRVPLLFNSDVICYRCKPEREQSLLFRNGTADEILFIYAGSGTQASS